MDFFAIGIAFNYLLWFGFSKRNYPIAHLDSLVIYLFSDFIGARLGHVFYDASYF